MDPRAISPGVRASGAIQFRHESLKPEPTAEPRATRNAPDGRVHVFLLGRFLPKHQADRRQIPPAWANSGKFPV